MDAPFEERADFVKLKEAAAMLRLMRPDLAKEIEIAVDELEELYEIHGIESAHR